MIPLNLVKDFASCRADREAIVDRNKTLTWIEYYNQSEQIFKAIHNTFNVSKIKSICYISPNRYELFIVAAAVATLKIPFVGIDYTQTPENIRHMLEVSTCDHLHFFLKKVSIFEALSILRLSSI